MQPINPSSLPIRSPLAKRLQNHVHYLASPSLKGRKPGTPGNQAAAVYIIKEFEHAGLRPLPSLKGFSQLISPAIGANIIGSRPASSSSPERWILIGAHYDHLGELGGRIYPGADDNGAAVGILLELARDLPPLHHYSVLMASFNSEEPPYIRTSLMGSQFFVNHLPPEISSPANIHAVMIMDLMGGAYWQPLQHIIFAAGAEHSPELYQRLKQHSRQTDPNGDLTICPIGLHVIEELPLLGQRPVSDYDAFRLASVPFIFLSAGRTPHYHQPTDQPDTLYYERMALTTLWLRDFLLSIDEDSAPLTYHSSRLEFADEVTVFRPLIHQAANRKTCIPGTSAASLMKMKMDAKWIDRLDPAKATKTDIRRLEKASLRMQCLLADIPIGFLL